MKIRVYYEDTDCGNVVYYANYLKYMERSRTEFLRERNIKLAEYRKQGVQFAVIEAQIKYRAAAKYDDLLEVDSTLSEVTSITVTFDTTIKDTSGRLLVSGNVKLACVGENGRAARIPAAITEALREAAKPPIMLA